MAKKGWPGPVEGKSGHGDKEWDLDVEGQLNPRGGWRETGMGVLRPRADVWGGSSSAWLPHLCSGSHLKHLPPRTPHPPTHTPCCSPLHATHFSGLRPLPPRPSNSRSGPGGQDGAVNMSSRAPQQPENKNEIPAVAPPSLPQPSSPPPSSSVQVRQSPGESGPWTLGPAPWRLVSRGLPDLSGPVSSPHPNHHRKPPGYPSAVLQPRPSPEGSLAGIRQPGGQVGTRG